MKSVLQERIESQSPDEVIQSLTESNELLKAQDSIKGVMFKIQKLFVPVFNKAKSLGMLKSFKLQIAPYNAGFELRTNLKIDFKFDVTKDNTSEVYSIFYNLSSVYFYASTFFQEDIDRGDNPYLEGYIVQTGPGDQKYFKETVKSKKDIKVLTDRYFKMNKVAIEKISKMLGK